jgi:CheY-like chemotaxis protein
MESIEPGELHGIHVLLVEDNEDALYILEYYLRHHGAMVTTATNGRDALAILRQVTPHVIVSDITMPGMTGLELIRKVRAMPGQQECPTPAIAVTAYPYHHQRNEALEAGFDAFVVKPIDPLVVVSYVSALYEQAGTKRRTGEFRLPGVGEDLA